MQGEPKVIALLQAQLKNELTAINQYFIHAKMCENWGYTRLAGIIRAESIDEMRHADTVISRILFLDGVPNLQRLHKLKVGETVKVQILSVDTERRRIGLSLRRLAPQPWEVIDNTYQVGQMVQGKITKLVNFGAFARLVDTGIEGLIHISELAERRVNHPKEVVGEGDVYELRIIRIESDKRRLGLSLKQAMPAQELDWQIAPAGSDDAEFDGDEVIAEAETVIAEVEELVETA